VRILRVLQPILAAVGAAFMTAVPALAAHDFPIAGLGDIWFQADHAGFMDADGALAEEFYFRIANNQVRFEGDEDPSAPREARVFVKLEFQDADEEKLGGAGQEFRFEVVGEDVAGSPDHSQLLLMREQVDPRTRLVRVEVEDLNSRKRGILYMVTGKRKNGVAEGNLVPAPFLDESGLRASDIQFAWEVGPGTPDSDFEKNGLNIVPNPSRTYGVLQSTASVYYEIYDDDEVGEGQKVFELRQTVISPDGEDLLTVLDTVAVRTNRFGRVFRFDVSQLPAGDYNLRVTALDLVSRRDVVTRRAFGMVWGDAWERTEAEVVNEARVLFQEEEFERFRAMSSGDREVYLQQFWASHDPSPETRGNELRTEFQRRVDYANRHFSAFGQKGMLTDQGRIYIRFGEPDEIERQMVPTGDHQLDQLVPDLEEENLSGRNLASNDEFDVRPYEVWTYTSTGYPLFPDREYTTSRTGLRFVFIDETGTGRWVLRYSSDFINY